jgi:hypothetical protein
MTDEYLVVDVNTVAHERVTLYLASLPDRGAALDLDERSDPRPCPKGAAIEVCEWADMHVLAKRDVVD